MIQPHLERWGERLLIDYLDEHARERPDAIAVVDYGHDGGKRKEISFAELRDNVDRIASSLIELGVEPGEIVSAQLPNWWHFIALHMACLRIGAIINPLMPIFRERELSFMLALAESKVVVVPKDFRGFSHAEMIARIRSKLPALRHVIVIGSDGDDSFDEMLLRNPASFEAAALFQEWRPRTDDTVQLLYTSGTTGEPKGVLHSSRTLMMNMIAGIEHIGLQREDVFLALTPMSHQLGFILALIAPSILGSKIVLQDIWNAATAAERVREHGVTFTTGATPFLSDLVEHAAKVGGVAPLKTFLSAGAPIPRQLVKRAREEVGFDVLSAYGMTENLLMSATRPGDPAQKVFETDGAPTAGAEVRVVDPDGRDLPVGQAGALVTRGVTMFQGYLKRPELNNRDADGWFETGDLARLDADGYLTITGRSKDIVIRGGENIPVVEIENVLYRHPAVLQVAIVGMPDPRLGERACAFAVVREGAFLTQTAIQDFLSENGVARSYWPERLEIIEALPTTATGKIQKFVLREMARQLT